MVWRNESGIPVREVRLLVLSLCLTFRLSLAATCNGSIAKPQELNKALVTAAGKGNLDEVTTLLDQGADPNATVTRDTWKLNALREAVSENHLEVVKLLLERDADPCLDGLTLMASASDRKHEAVARLLVSCGLKVDEPDGDGETILMGKFRYSPSDPDDVAFLLELGADPNAKTDKGLTPLMMAAGRSAYQESEQQTVMKQIALLISGGARVNDKDNSGATALIRAVEDGPIVAIRALVEAGADVNVQTATGYSALLVALGANHRDGRIEYLIEHGADVKAHDKEGQTALMLAIGSGYPKQAALCLQRGVDPNAKTIKGLTAAHFAAGYYSLDRDLRDDSPADIKGRKDGVDMLRLLALHHADLSVPDLDGATPLHCAARFGYVENLQFLLNRTEDLNKGNKTGESPLFLSVCSDLDAFAKTKLLLASGADVNVRGPFGRTALMWAAVLMLPGPVIQLLQQHANANLVDSTGNTALSLAAASCRERAVEPRQYVAIIRALANTTTVVEQRDSHGMTPLMWTAISNIPDASLVLLEKGADINGRGSDGRTALMWGASANATRTTATLISHGADREIRDDNGMTALDWARVLDETVSTLPSEPVEQP